MGEWKGPWTCDKCGRDFPCIDPNGHSATYPKIINERCTGTLTPHDRRASADDYREGVKAVLPYADHTWACRMKHGGDRCNCGFDRLLAKEEA